jgi:serine/threonine-protein kinase
MAATGRVVAKLGVRIPVEDTKTASESGGRLDLKSGVRLGKYRLEKHLGTGGSCEVWKATDCVEDIVVALKIPLIDVSGKRDGNQLFKEIRLVAKLRHPHIMPVKNADIIEDHVVLATELSVGTLDDRSRPMSPRRILLIMTQVLRGLRYAHKNRVVHCDVTPGNIFLFPNGRAALGDFGISLRFKGRMVTIDDFGTPGYVAPEQAYGRPTYRSDCFAVGLILYEYLTGILPHWPFRWPFKGHERLRSRTSMNFAAFLRKALQVDPARRFANAEEMLSALLAAAPKKLLTVADSESADIRRIDWRRARRDAFRKKYARTFTTLFRCVDCREPIAEGMSVCPWCGSSRNRFDTRTQFSRICPDCHKGVLPEWRFCPWCYGPGFASPSERATDGVRYQARCKHCGGKMLRFMRYCPWCHRKVRQPWRVAAFPEVCGRCKWSVDSEFWNYCPWCSQGLV